MVYWIWQEMYLSGASIGIAHPIRLLHLIITQEDRKEALTEYYEVGAGTVFHDVLAPLFGQLQNLLVDISTLAFV
jgi:hypothetical protein